MDPALEVEEEYDRCANINYEAYNRSHKELMGIFCDGKVDEYHGVVEQEEGIVPDEEVFRVLDHVLEAREPNKKDGDENLKPSSCSDSDASGASNYPSPPTSISAPSAVELPEVSSDTKVPQTTRKLSMNSLLVSTPDMKTPAGPRKQSVQSLLVSSPDKISPWRPGIAQNSLPAACNPLPQHGGARSQTGFSSSTPFSKYTWPSQLISQSTTRPRSSLRNSISVDTSDSVRVDDHSRPSSRSTQGYAHQVQAHNESALLHEPSLVGHQGPYFRPGYFYPHSHLMNQPSHDEYSPVKQENSNSSLLPNNQVAHQPSYNSLGNPSRIKASISDQPSNHPMIDLEEEDLSENHSVIDIEEQTSDEDQRQPKIKYESLRHARMEQSKTISIQNPPEDYTAPRTDEDDRSYVAVMMVAMYSMSHAEDNKTMLQTWRNSWGDKERVEKAVWEVLDYCKRRHERNGPFPLSKKPQNDYATFKDRMGAVCEAMLSQKTVCKNLMKQPYAEEVVENPNASIARIRNNRKVNQGKREAIELGREALGRSISRKRGRAKVLQDEADDELDGAQDDDEGAFTDSPSPSPFRAQNIKRRKAESDDNRNGYYNQDTSPKKARRANPATYPFNQGRETMATPQPQSIPEPYPGGRDLQPRNSFAPRNAPDASQNEQPSVSTARVEYNQNDQARVGGYQINQPHLNGIQGSKQHIVSSNEIKDQDHREAPRTKRVKRANPNVSQLNGRKKKGNSSPSKSPLSRRLGSQHSVPRGVQYKPNPLAHAPQAGQYQQPSAPGVLVRFGQNRHSQSSTTQGRRRTEIHPAQNNEAPTREAQIDATHQTINGIEAH